jgi:hypothetical protein
MRSYSAAQKTKTKTKNDKLKQGLVVHTVHVAEVWTHQLNGNKLQFFVLFQPLLFVLAASLRHFSKIHLWNACVLNESDQSEERQVSEEGDESKASDESKKNEGYGNDESMHGGQR